MGIIYSNRNFAIVKTFASVLTLFLGYTNVWPQDNKFHGALESKGKPKLEESVLPNNSIADLNVAGEKVLRLPEKKIDFLNLNAKDLELGELENTEIISTQSILLQDKLRDSNVEEKQEFQIKIEKLPKRPQKFENAEKFHWKPAIIQSLYFLGIQHGFRMVQKKTKDEIDGEFFADWGQSVRNLRGWRDGDSFATNYIAHPMQGAVTGRIFINNSDKSKKLEFGKSKDYWESRFKTMAWSAVWSAQFELGPISEASIGNVGLYDRTGPNRMGWVDLVVTPTAGTGAIIGEDMIDKYILKKWLEKGSSRTRIKIFRTFFTPFQSFTNVLRLKAPWKRDNR